MVYKIQDKTGNISLISICSSFADVLHDLFGSGLKRPFGAYLGRPRDDRDCMQA